MPALTDAPVDALKSAHASPSPCAPDSLSRFAVRKRRVGPAVLARVDALKSAHASPSPCAPDPSSRFVVRKKRIGPAVLAPVMR